MNDMLLFRWSSFFLDRVMLWAMGYFIYDIFAMYEVYLAKCDNSAVITPSGEPDNGEMGRPGRAKAENSINKSTYEGCDSITTSATKLNNAIRPTNTDVHNSSVIRNRGDNRDMFATHALESAVNKTNKSR